MEEFIDRLTNLLRNEFPGSTPELEQVCPIAKVGGFLLWDGFEDLEQIDRQRRLGQVMRRVLPPDEQLQVTTILTLTPDEALAMRGE